MSLDDRHYERRHEDRRESTCVFHDGNVCRFTTIEQKIDAMKLAEEQMMLTITKIKTWSMVKAASFGVLLGIMSALSIQIYSTVTNDINTLRATVQTGMQKRIELEGRMNAVQDDIAEIKARRSGH
jgi:hypothetical protein